MKLKALVGITVLMAECTVIHQRTREPGRKHLHKKIIYSYQQYLLKLQNGNAPINVQVGTSGIYYLNLRIIFYHLP